MNRFLYFVLMLAAWLLLTCSFDRQNVVAGVVVSILVTVFAGRLFFDNIRAMFNPRRIFWFLYYIPFFAWHIVMANLDVAYRVLHVNLPIRPGIVKVKTTLKSDLGRTFLANSITLTPGTLTVDIIGSDLYIHWIYIHSDDPERQTEMIVSRFENILKKVFE
jgi:multicomponent Na+:H+ antiporter subunit E